MKRIFGEPCRPAGKQARTIGFGPPRFIGAIVAAEGGGFVVDQPGLGRNGDRAPAAAYAQAVIDIVERGSERFIQSTEAFEQVAPGQQAGAGNSGNLPRRRTAPRAASNMLTRAVRPEHDARVLDGAVGEKQRGADHAGSWVVEVPRHVRQPVGSQGRDVIIQQAQQIPCRVVGRDVVRNRIVEAKCVMRDHPHPRVGLQPSAHLFLRGVERSRLGDDDDDFQVRIRGSFQDEAQAALDPLLSQRRGDQDTDAARFRFRRARHLDGRAGGIVSAVRQHAGYVHDCTLGVDDPKGGSPAHRVCLTGRRGIEKLRPDEPKAARQCAAQECQTRWVRFEIGACASACAIQPVIIGERGGGTVRHCVAKQRQRVRARQFPRLEQRDGVAVEAGPGIGGAEAYNAHTQLGSRQRAQRGR